MVGCQMVGEYVIRGRLGPGLLTAVHPVHGRLAIRRCALDADSAAATLLQHEVLTARQLQHTNLLACYDAFVDGLYLYVVAPLMDLGSARDLINRHYTEGLPEPACAYILRETLQGLDYIHKKGYIHRGIRSSHILLCSSGRVCISGLKTAASLMHQGKRQKALHTLPPPDHKALLWLSPELLEQNLRGYDEKSDIYSTGMLSCELGNGAIPFSGIPTTLMLTEKVRGNAPHLLDHTTFDRVMNLQNCNREDAMLNDISLNDNRSCGSSNMVTQIYYNRRFSNAFHDFTNRCFERDPTIRPSCAQLLNHSFIKQVKSESLLEILTEARPVDEEPCDTTSLALEEQLTYMEINPCEWDF